MKNVKYMLFIISISLFCFGLADALRAQEAKFTHVEGIVLLSMPSKLVRIARVGLTVPAGTIVRTGFASWATLQTDTTVTTLSPLSKMRIAEISISVRKAKVKLQLRRGTLRARVKRIIRIRTSFKVSSPIATTSVRGTELEITHGPAFGTSVRMIDGTSYLSDKIGISRRVQREGLSRVAGTKPPTSDLDENNSISTVQIASHDITEEEHNSIINSNEVIMDTLSENPVKAAEKIIEEAKEVDVSGYILFD